jgi:hypothetical protein
MLRDSFVALRAYLPGSDSIRTSDQLAERLGAYDQAGVMAVAQSNSETGDVDIFVEHSGDGVHWTSYHDGGFDFAVPYEPGFTQVVWSSIFDNATPPQRYVRLRLSKIGGGTDVWVELSVGLRDLDVIPTDSNATAERAG